ncbi:hypothetical protein [Lichenifustis flavocetrariae]|uniref:Uncharacterized protein n=1 Tax=Lichenifustis flavocetrariae TaxID=2949735 RepID=A0AA41Z0N8_9HYPH|nr:hypothetical protein [Lichenifustis flavocetrariae]MCW6512044.1 hypothetical protein [Lichenifustis flavocetrariae]
MEEAEALQEVEAVVLEEAAMAELAAHSLFPEMAAPASVEAVWARDREKEVFEEVAS